MNEQAQVDYVLTNIRLPRLLKSRLEVIRAHMSLREGKRWTMNQLMVWFLEQDVDEIVEHNEPGALDKGLIDMSFMLMD